MLRLALSSAVLLLVCCSPLAAQPVGEQPAGPTPAELRRQLEQLQQQLREMEKADLGKRRVTTIGSAGAAGRGGVIRVYDLGDLFTIAPAYPAPVENAVGFSGGLIFGNSLGMAGGEGVAPGGFGGMGGMGGGFFSVREGLGTVRRPAGEKDAARQFGLDGTATLQTTVDKLIAVIQQTISPELWTEGEGSIAQLGANLIVVADETTHQQIDDMLNLFRKRWGSLRTISVRAWWVWLTDAELTALLADPNAVGEDGVKAFGLVKPDAWKQLLQPPQDDANGDGERRAGWQAAITCYNGQTVHTLSGGQRTQIIGVTPSVSENEVAYSPLIGLLQQGVALQVTPVTNTSGQTVLLDVRSRVCLLADQEDQQRLPEKAKKVETLPARENPAAAVAAVVNRPKVQLHRLATTLRVPVGQPMLVGGMTFEERPEPGQPNLYLFVETYVQELRNDEPTDAQVEAPAEKE